MLALVTILLATFLFAATTVWLYRLIFRRKGANRRLAGRSRSAMNMKLSAQQGYVRLASRLEKTPEKPVKVVKLRTVQGGVRTPWGW